MRPSCRWHLGACTLTILTDRLTFLYRSVNFSFASSGSEHVTDAADLPPSQRARRQRIAKAAAEAIQIPGGAGGLEPATNGFTKRGSRWLPKEPVNPCPTRI
jgi:hypothetical protein